MDHREAQRIYEEIQSRPYCASTQPNVPANNCYFKGIELLQRVGVLGYAVRGRVGETYWDASVIPQRIIDLYPQQHLVTHFFVEAEIDGQWRTLDPTFDPALAKAGFRVAGWGGANAPCFDITKLYSQDEAIAYQAMWADPTYAAAYFTEAAAFLSELNLWLETARHSENGHIP